MRVHTLLRRTRAGTTLIRDVLLRHCFVDLAPYSATSMSTMYLSAPRSRVAGAPGLQVCFGPGMGCHVLPQVISIAKMRRDAGEIAGRAILQVRRVVTIDCGDMWIGNHASPACLWHMGERSRYPFPKIVWDYIELTRRVLTTTQPDARIACSTTVWTPTPGGASLMRHSAATAALRGIAAGYRHATSRASTPLRLARAFVDGAPEYRR